MKSSFVTLLCITAHSVLALFPARADDWPYYQHDAWHTGASSAVVNPQALSFAWPAPSPPPSTTGYSTPVIVGNTIYAMQESISASHTTVSSFDISTGGDEQCSLDHGRELGVRLRSRHTAIAASF
jgi:hypothetical protein